MENGNIVSSYVFYTVLIDRRVSVMSALVTGSFSTLLTEMKGD